MGVGGRKGGYFSRSVLVWDIPCEERTLFTLAPAEVCLRKALMAPETCAAGDLLLLHSHTKHSWDPPGSPNQLLRVSSVVLAFPFCPEIPTVTAPMLSGVAGSGVVRGRRLCHLQTWSSSLAVSSRVADA